MARSTVFDAYQNAYHKAATITLFRNFNPVRNKASFVYTDAGSGGLTNTAGLVDVYKYDNKEVHYQPRLMVSGSIALSIEGKAAFMSTLTQSTRIVLTAAQATRFQMFNVTEKFDHMRVGVRAASPAAADSVNIYLTLK